MAGYLKRLLLLPLVVSVWFYCSPLSATAQTSAEMVLNVSVVTETRAPVGGLGRENFSVTVNKVPRDIVSFSDREVPASVGILIDTSGSFDPGKKEVAELKQNLKEGLERLVRLSHPSNEYFVMSFNVSTTLVQDWTSEYSAVANSTDSLTYKGQTTLYDAIFNGIGKLTTGRNAKKVLIVFSDGMDNQSRSSFKQVVEALKRSDVLLFAAGIFGYYKDMPLMYEEATNSLDELAGWSGGRAVFMRNASKAAFLELFEYLGAQFRGQYQLTISPQETSGKQKWHKLAVKVTKNDPSGRPEKMYIRTKRGYYR